MNELNWLVVDKIQASKFEPEYKNVVKSAMHRCVAISQKQPAPEVTRAERTKQ